MNTKEYESSSEYATSEEEKPKAIRKNVKPVEIKKVVEIKEPKKIKIINSSLLLLCSIKK